MADSTLVLLRHGESEWNALNLFTGWVDVDLTEKGRREAVRGGALMAEQGLLPDVLYTSLLRRAITTANLALDACDRHWIPVIRNWRLNERHYGALQGLNKAETAAKFGDQQVLIWRRAYAVAPDPLPAGDPRESAGDPRYAHVDPATLPRTECLKDTVARVVPVWNDSIAPAIKLGKQVIVAAHGNSLRALVKHLDGVADDKIVELNIPTARPLVYELDAQLQPLKNYYLGDPAEIAAAMAAVAAQGKAKAQPG